MQRGVSNTSKILFAETLALGSIMKIIVIIINAIITCIAYMVNVVMAGKVKLPLLINKRQTIKQLNSIHS